MVHSGQHGTGVVLIGTVVLIGLGSIFPSAVALGEDPDGQARSLTAWGAVGHLGFQLLGMLAGGGGEGEGEGEGECPFDGGDCCDPNGNGTPGCDDVLCCETVCAIDSFCCDIEWDTICADEAMDLCPDACGFPCDPADCDDGDICTNDSCHDGLCQNEKNNVCCEDCGTCDGDVNCDGAVDPLDSGAILARFGQETCADDDCKYDVNCDGEIDPLDSGYVLARFGTCSPVPFCIPDCPLPFVGCTDSDCPNDNCADYVEIFDGLTEYSNIGATSDGAELPVECDKGFGLDLGNDIWCSYSASCTGIVTVSTCDHGDPSNGDVNYDSRLAAYAGLSCPADNADLVGCNDDGDGCAGFTSILTFDATEGGDYLVRIGGFGEGSTGSGTVFVGCE